MSGVSAYIPAKEVLRVGISALARLGLGVIVSLAIMKLGQTFLGWNAHDAVQYAEYCTGIFFVASWYVAPVELPKVAYRGGAPESLPDA